MSDKTIIPLFPLPLVVCPGETLPLHIFEERYKEMIAYCRGNENQPSSLFGVSLAYNNKLYSIGCAVKIENIVKEYADGRLDVINTGVKRYKMNEIYKDKAYVRASIDYFDDEDTVQADKKLVKKALKLHKKLNELIKGETIDQDIPEDKQVSFVLAHSAGFDVLQKQRLIEMLGENKRLEFLVEHFEKVLPEIERTEEIKRRVLSNGHFKNLRSSDI